MDITLAIIEFMRFLKMHSNYLFGPFSWYNIVYCIGLLIAPTGQVFPNFDNQMKLPKRAGSGFSKIVKQILAIQNPKELQVRSPLKNQALSRSQLNTMVL